MNKLVFADSLRGIAALCVLVGHYTGGFWLARPTIANMIGSPSLPDTIPAPAAFLAINGLWIGWGPFGVGLFFLISGFVIPFSFRKYNPAGFLVNRALRIYPVYAVGFCVTIAFLTLSRWWYFDRTDIPFSLGHLFVHFIPGLRDTFNYPSIDGIIWTLEVEVRFYLICACAYPLFKSLSRRVLVIPLFIAAIIPVLGIDIPGLIQYQQSYYSFAMNVKVVLIYIIFMFIGVAFHLHYEQRLPTNYLWISSVILFTAFCSAFATGPQNQILIQTVLSYAAALILFSTAYAFRGEWKQAGITKFFASISYPLYVVHGVMGFVIMRIAIDLGLGAWAAVLLATCASIFAAYVLHLVVEEPTRRAGQSIGREIPGQLGSTMPMIPIQSPTSTSSASAVTVEVERRIA